MKTINSVELAAITDKSHADIKRSISKMIKLTGADPSNFKSTYYFEPTKQNYPCFIINQPQAECLTSEYTEKSKSLIKLKFEDLDNTDNKSSKSLLTQIEEELNKARENEVSLQFYKNKCTKLEDENKNIKKHLMAMKSISKILKTIEE
jgi:hypothetical protein